MLVLERRENEGLNLFTETGEEIKIVVVTAQGGRAKVSINAPRDILILRDELISLASPQGQSLIQGYR